MLFYFFMSDDLSFINTTQKTFKPSKKIVSMPRMDEKKLHTWEFQLKRSSRSIWDASCFKKGLLEKQMNVPNTCTILPLKKIFYQNLTVNRWIFQIPLKYIKLVIPKILFMLVLRSFNFSFKIKIKRKIPLNRFKFFAVKSFISSPSNSNFQVIILCNLHL